MRAATALHNTANGVSPYGSVGYGRGKRTTSHRHPVRSATTMTRRLSLAPWRTRCLCGAVSASRGLPLPVWVVALAELLVGEELGSPCGALCAGQLRPRPSGSGSSSRLLEIVAACRGSIGMAIRATSYAAIPAGMAFAPTALKPLLPPDTVLQCLLCVDHGPAHRDIGRHDALKPCRPVEAANRIETRAAPGLARLQASIWVSILLRNPAPLRAPFASPAHASAA